MSKQTQIWISPTLCGCILERTYTWSVSSAVRERVMALNTAQDQEIGHLWMRYLLDIGHFDQVDTSYEILRQCRQHSHLCGPASLSAELLHWCQNAFRPNTCKCSLSYCFDRRLGPNYEVIALDHPVHTLRCSSHEYLIDVEDHARVVRAENAAPGLALAEFRKAYYFDYVCAAGSTDERRLVWNVPTGRVFDTSETANRLHELLNANV